MKRVSRRIFLANASLDKVVIKDNLNCEVTEHGFNIPLVFYSGASSRIRSMKS